MTHHQVRQVVPPWVLAAARRAGRLRRVLPEVYVDAGRVATGTGRVLPLSALDPNLRHRAVLAYLAETGGFSHTTALDVWGLRRQPPGEPIHVSVPAGSSLRSLPGLVVHHRRALPLRVWRGAPVSQLENSLVDAWPLLSAAERPGPAIQAVNDRRTTPQRIGAALDTVPRLAGRAALRILLDRLAAGCRSALEIWGHDHVLTGPGMPSFKRQVRIRVGRRTVYLDVYAERERVDIELDGATSHADARQRETDLRRDALLATMGILVVRFSHARLTGQPDEVRAEILSILANRRG
ncbi:endonuclease domain-containing protein [Polymorphospora rubra]|uniref:endonuclease domain-containing protein n=1 Tax=Polymorphospora rubra TaxID=338584 RepID=UPI001FE41628|nr:DUF559 domain-containing protein [Polymorphospora rubra]